MNIENGSMLMGLGKKEISDLTAEIESLSQKVNQFMQPEELDEVFRKIAEAETALHKKIEQLKKLVLPSPLHNY